MIQLPSKIRTTLFNAVVEKEPFELFSHEDDRILVLIYAAFTQEPLPAFGRSGQDVLNSDSVQSIPYAPIMFYGPEPLWMGASTRTTFNPVPFVLVHAIYRV